VKSKKCVSITSQGLNGLPQASLFLAALTETAAENGNVSTATIFLSSLGCDEVTFSLMVNNGFGSDAISSTLVLQP
jgi:hypothetical protein